MTVLRTLAFGDRSVWGASWSSDSAGSSLTALGAGPQATVLPGVRLPESDAGADAEWRLDIDDVALVVTPAGEPVDVQAAQDGIEGWDQLCRVSGRFGQYEVDCLGVRSGWSDAIDLKRYQSIRAVSVWFGPDEAFAVTAFRPRKAKAHDADLLAAAVIAAERSAPVEDPRLSTTYAADGWPARAGLELWLAAPEGSDSEQQYTRRASGEAIGTRAQAQAGELELRAEPFRWHSRAREGTGMYLLARRR
jgi:hypothetical protein